MLYCSWPSCWPPGWLPGRRGGHQKLTAKADSTLRSSRAVPHPSTDRALRRLTSEVGRDPVHSTRYGRQRCLQHLIKICALTGGCRGTRLPVRSLSLWYQIPNPTQTALELTIKCFQSEAGQHIIGSMTIPSRPFGYDQV